MKERPILMTPENAQKCHDGTKTQTRRIVKDINNAMHCPYGVVGDRLWVREAWSRMGCKQDCGHLGCHTIYQGAKSVGAYGCVKWKPSIHMPRQACRTVLEITALRVERLHEITEEDAIAEGVNRIAHGRDGDYYSAFRDEPHHDNWIDPVDAYKELWESINGKGSWAANPPVRVVSFRRVNP